MESDKQKYLLHIGEIIKAARLKLGMKEDALAITIGVTHGTINKIEHGKYPGLKFTTLMAICKCLQIPMSELPPHIE